MSLIACGIIPLITQVINTKIEIVYMTVKGDVIILSLFNGDESLLIIDTL